MPFITNYFDTGSFFGHSLPTDLDRIITQIVKPKVSVYMAIDGVAPRAKMNQQRSRRFRSAKDLAEATKDKRIVPTDGNTSGADAADPYSGAFDSNCITPGTEFLLRISECIRYFIRKKIKEDPLWKNLSVIFSGPEVPGEGEHKVSYTMMLCPGNIPMHLWYHDFGEMYANSYSPLLQQFYHLSDHATHS